MISFSPFPKQQILDSTKLKAFADKKINVEKHKTKIIFGMVWKHCGKRRKYWLPYCRVVKSWDCVVKSYSGIINVEKREKVH